MKLLLPALLAALFFNFISGVHATQFTPLSVEEMTAKADLVVQGTVARRTCERSDDGGIVTRVEIVVSDIWKGQLATNRCTVILAGGILGDEAEIVPGQAGYEIGEEVVAFLVLNGRGEGVTIGLAQGKFEVRTDPATGRKLARNLFHGNGGVTPPRPAVNGKTVTILRGPLGVDDLKQRVTGGVR